MAITHLIVTLIIVCLHFGTEQTFNYYRFWGGTARRLDNREDEKALAEYMRARTLNPEDYRASRGEALIHHRAGRGPQAREAVARALELKPDDPQALQIERYWRNRQ